jgi:hypothetical protein
LIPALHDLQQRLADLAQTNNDNARMHSSSDSSDALSRGS